MGWRDGWFRALAALERGPGIYMVAHNHLTPFLRDTVPSKDIDLYSGKYLYTIKKIKNSYSPK